MEYIVEVQHLYKTFQTKDAQVEALKDISLQVEKGDIYGIIGMSGAGKSTLVRCLNFLEVPTRGSVLVEGQPLSELSGPQLRKLRSPRLAVVIHGDDDLPPGIVQGRHLGVVLPEASHEVDALDVRIFAAQ